MYKKLNERGYWLIEMNIRKIIQASAFSLIALNLVQKAVLHFLLNVLDCIKSALQNKQVMTFNEEHLKEKSWKH